MSGIVLNECLIDPTQIKSTTITINRIAHNNSGVRIWYIILADTGICYQRWSMLMNPTDEILMLAKPGDKLSIDYIEDYVEDPISQQFKPFKRNVILNVNKQSF